MMNHESLAAKPVEVRSSEGLGLEAWNGTELDICGLNDPGC